jgi:hypothetical protein
MQRLKVNSDWLPRDLVNRVQAEVPIEKPVYLTVGRVQNLLWGVTTDADSSDEKHFDMSLPAHRRGTQIAWFGTRAHPDFQISLQADGLVGQAALRLRWSEAAPPRGLVVTLSNRTVTVHATADGRTSLLRELTRSGAGPQRPLSLALRLQGGTLEASVDGRPAIQIALPSNGAAGAEEGIVQLSVYDSIKGSARLDGARILYEPLTSL